MAEVTLRIKGDIGDVERKIDRIGKALANLQGRASGGRTTATGTATGSSAAGLQFFGFDTRQLQKVLDMSKRLNDESVRNAQRASQERQRIAEIEARHGARMAEIQERGRVQAANAAARSIEAAKRREYQEYVRLERQKTTEANAEARRRASFGLSGSRVQNLGQNLSIGVTAPIAAAAYKVGSYGLDMQALRNQLTAFEGDASKAEARLERLRAVSDKFAGATRDMTYSVYSLLKPLNSMSDDTIEKTIGALGKLQLGFKNMIPSDFAYNLTQIFSQGFEEQDIKQAIGQVPKFREYLAKAFGTGDNKSLKMMKESGKLTMDQFFTGIAEAVQNDSALKGLKEPVALRMQKFFERAFEAIEPLANVIVDGLSKAIEFASPWLVKLSEFLNALSPAAQYAVVGIAAIAAAIGPVILVVSKLIVAFETVAGVMSTISAAAGGIGLAPLVGIAAAVVAALAELAAVAYLVYKAWQTNFGGLQTFTLAVWAKIEDAVSGAVNAIEGLVRDVGGQIVMWWRDNWPLIQQTVETVSDAIKSNVQALLDGVGSFWQAHGAKITAWARAAWSTVQTIVTAAVTQLGNVVRLGLQLINGDWAGAWSTFLGMVQTAGRDWVTITKKMTAQATAIFEAMIPVVKEIFLRMTTATTELLIKAVTAVGYILATLPQQVARLTPKFVAAGMSIANALWEGIKQGMAGQESGRLMQEASGSIEIVGMSAEAAYVPVNKLGEGLANLGAGGGSKMQQKLSEIQQLRKDAEEASKSLQFLYGNPEAQGLTVGIANINDEKSKLTELLQLRAKYADLAARTGPLPVGSAALDAQIKQFKDAENGIAAARDMVEKFDREIRGLDKSKSYVEQLNDVLSDPKVLMMIDAETAALWRQKAALADRTVYAQKVAEMQKQNSLEAVDRLADLRLEIDLLTAASKIDAERLRQAAEIEKFKRHNADVLNPDDLQRMVEYKEAIAARVLELTKGKEATNDQVEADKVYGQMLDQLNDKIFEMNELTEVDRAKKELLTATTKNLTDAQKENILARAAEADAMKAAKEAQEKYKQVFEDTSYYIEDKLQTLRQSGFKGLFRSLLQDIEDFLIRAAAKFLASKFLQLLQGRGINVGGGGSRGGSWMDTIFNGGGGSGSGGGLFSGNAGGGIFNFGGSGSSAGGFSFGLPNLRGGTGVAMSGGSSSGMFLGGLPLADTSWAKFINPRAGGPSTTSGTPAKAGGGIGLAGGLALAGTAAAMVGGAIGGRAGSFISNIGSGVASGASLGMMFGGPLGAGIGAAIGGGIGLLQSLLGGDPKRRVDNRENMPKLMQGFSDASTEFLALIADVNSLRTDPDSALARGRELRSSIASGFGIDFQSKKYKKLAAQQIAQQLAAIDRMPDGLMDQLARAVAIAKVAGERNGRLLPEFANGGAVSRFFQTNFAGLVPGVYDRADDKLIRVSGNEVVLTPNQWRPITPYLSSAGVPGFADGGAVSQKGAGGPLQVNIVLKGVTFNEGAEAYLLSDSGERTVVNVLTKIRKNGTQV